ncbi:putative leucine-rich repeat-containing protein DDB_G0290503 isoform X2 [Dysidea avara]|uniref:putative leucine-rich repeat-containing protein DDB_G0290503 isoform X2 n=1 Tax=Dysidea avara TaxID=196820 RepID=UPI00332DD00D
MSADKELLRYCPEKDLPDEIKSLPKNEVVCQFCGVSYLIHHEIKELQGKLKYLESCSNQLEECRKRENGILQKIEEQKLLLDSQNTEIEQEMFNERLQIQTSNLLSVKRDISTARNQLQSLSREQCDSISSVTAKIKLTLTKNLAILLERISQLSTQYDQLWQVKRNMDSENKRLVDSIKESESQLNQKTEEDKIVLSQLRREINDLKEQMTQSSSDLAAEQLIKENLELKLRTVKGDNSKLTKLLSDKSSEHAREKERLQLMASQLETKLQSAEAELAIIQSEYSDAIQTHLSNTMASAEAVEVERNEKEQLIKERELLIECHQNRLQELQEHFKGEKEKLELQLTETQRASSEELSQLQSSMEAKLVMEVKKAREAVEIEYDNLLRVKTSGLQQVEDELSSVTEKYTHEIADLKEQLKIKQLENDAELTAHIHQVKDLELKLKQSIEDDTDRRSLEETMATQVKQLSEQVSSLQHQLQEQESQCSKLSEELQQSQEEVEHLQNTVHLECKERIELTEALEQAREQLLTYKMKDKTHPISANHTPTPPPQQNHHGNTMSSLNHSRQRIAQVTGRVSKSDYRHSKSGRF